MESLKDVPVVITGASSGIGRATALAFAEMGARLVLAARGADPLRATAAECNRLGGHALAVPTDVTDPAAVHRLLRLAIGSFGAVRVWINNAGVGLVGRYWEAPLDAHRRVVETNLIGAMNGAHAVIPHFLEEGRGVLINTVSIGAWVAPPYAAAYSASKFGLHGFTRSLREELSHYPNIHVCGVYPTMVNTPGPGHGANYLGRRLNPKGPLLDPFDVAKAMVDLALHPRHEAKLGLGIEASRLSAALAPHLTQRLTAMIIDVAVGLAKPETRHQGNLFAPAPGGGDTHGGPHLEWGNASLGPLLAAAAGFAATLAAARRPARGRRPSGPHGRAGAR